MDFKYENIATFCFYCGTVGHSEKNCLARKSDAKNRTVLEGQYGDWLKADQGRGRNKQHVELRLREDNPEGQLDGVGKIVEQENRHSE